MLSFPFSPAEARESEASGRSCRVGTLAEAYAAVDWAFGNVLPLLQGHGHEGADTVDLYSYLLPSFLSDRERNAIMREPFAIVPDAGDASVYFANGEKDHASWRKAFDAALTAEANQLQNVKTAVEEYAKGYASLAERKRIVVRTLTYKAYHAREVKQNAPLLLPLPSLAEVDSASHAAVLLGLRIRALKQVDAAMTETVPPVIPLGGVDERLFPSLARRYLEALYENFVVPWFTTLGKRADFLPPEGLGKWAEPAAVEELQRKFEARLVTLAEVLPGQLAECVDHVSFARSSGSNAAVPPQYDTNIPLVITLALSYPLFASPATLCSSILHSLAHRVVLLDTKNLTALEDMHALGTFYRALRFCVNVAAEAGLLGDRNAFGLPVWYGGDRAAWPKRRPGQKKTTEDFDLESSAPVLVYKELSDEPDASGWTSAVLENWLRDVRRGKGLSFKTAAVVGQGKKRLLEFDLPDPEEEEEEEEEEEKEKEDEEEQEKKDDADEEDEDTVEFLF